MSEDTVGMSKEDTQASSESIRQHVLDEWYRRGSEVRDRRVKLVEHFQKLNPPMYARVEGSEVAEEFLNRAEMVFELLRCTNEENVILALYSLQQEADAWRKATRENVALEYPGEFLFTAREHKVREFDVLEETEEMTVDQYVAKF